MCVASLTRTHIPRLVQDRRRTRPRVSNLLLPPLLARYLHTHAAALDPAMHPPPDPTDVFQPLRSKAEITFLIWLIPNAPVRCRETPSVFRNTLPISSAHYARRSSHGRIICALISEPTPTSDRSCVQSAARHSPVNMTENDTKGCILVRRNSSAEAICHEMETGVVVVDSPVPTLLVAISDLKQVESASSPC